MYIDVYCVVFIRWMMDRHLTAPYRLPGLAAAAVLFSSRYVFDCCSESRAVSLWLRQKTGFREIIRITKERRFNEPARRRHQPSLPRSILCPTLCLLYYLTF